MLFRSAEISILRHSEIQRLLAERRRKAAEEEDRATRVVKKRKQNKKNPADEPKRYANDDAYQSQDVDVALTYDEGDASEPAAKTFQWPMLGR